MSSKTLNTASDSLLRLADFFPYKLSRLNAQISNALAQVYSGRFDLAPQEWKVMAALGENREMSAKEIAAFTSMEKMQVSRAVTELKKLELLVQTADEDDRRYSCLRLTTSGEKMYQEIVPLVIAREAFLLDALTEDELDQFNGFLEKITRKAASLEKLG